VPEPLLLTPDELKRVLKLKPLVDDLPDQRDSTIDPVDQAHLPPIDKLINGWQIGQGNERRESDGGFSGRENFENDPTGIPSLLDFIRKNDAINQNQPLQNLQKTMADDMDRWSLEQPGAMNLSEKARNAMDASQKNREQDFVVLDEVEFTRGIKLIHALLNPPSQLHPWLKWLFYASRITPAMLDLYYKALAKRDQIYLLAARSEGKLKIRYNHKIMETPVYIWPDQAEGPYELVMVPERGMNPLRGALTSQPQLKTSTPSS